VGWGRNFYGLTDVPKPNTEFVSIAAGWYHNLGLKADGSIVAWGDNSGQTNVPSPNTNFVAVAAGNFHSLGLKGDGSVAAWGCPPFYNYGQCEAPRPNSGFVAVVAGQYHSLALHTDGSIVAWGRNDYGQTDTPDPNTGFVAIAAGGNQSRAIRRISDCNRNGLPDKCEIARGERDDNTNSIPDICEARGDFNGDGGVNLIDYAQLFACLDGPDGGIGEGCFEEDLSGDNAVDLIGLAFFFNQAGQPPP
jgi:hypothetical protein